MYDIYGRYKIGETVRWTICQVIKTQVPVRIGNLLAKQMQHDVYGEVLMAVEDWTRHFQRGRAHPGILLLREMGHETIRQMARAG